MGILLKEAYQGVDKLTFRLCWLETPMYYKLVWLNCEESGLKETWRGYVPFLFKKGEMHICLNGVAFGHKRCTCLLDFEWRRLFFPDQVIKYWPLVIACAYVESMKWDVHVHFKRTWKKCREAITWKGTASNVCILYDNSAFITVLTTVHKKLTETNPPYFRKNRIFIIKVRKIFHLFRSHGQ